MSRLTQLLGRAFVLLLFSTFSAAKPNPPSKSQCKAVPGTPSWPAATSWARLNESTGGRLLQPVAPGAVCHPGQSTFNPAECTTVNASWSSHDFHTNNPISVSWNQWTNDSCLPWDGYPCSGSGYPVFVVNASTAHHVKAAVDFARANMIRLVIKSSGHDFIGRSVAPNALSIWVHHLKGTPQPHASFRPKNCKIVINSTAVTVGGGTQMEELYAFLDTLNQTTIGGGGKTVSLGGYLTGGGHGLLSPTHGLAADQVLEMEVVTPTGQIVTANECSNTDLFFAMRGGGGSTFGIITSVTLKTFPSPQITARTVAIVTTNLTSTATMPMVAYFLSQFPALADKGLSGYAPYFQSFPNPFAPDDPTPLAGILLVGVLQNAPSSAMDALLNPVLAHINDTWPGVFQIVQLPSTFPSFYAWFRENFDRGEAGENLLGGSRLLGRPEMTRNLTQSADALTQMVGLSGLSLIHLVSGKGVAEAQPRGGENAVCPAWRKAYVHITNGLAFPPLDPSARRNATRRLDASLQRIRALAPEMGAYMNEAFYQEPDWQHQFWGKNYERLVRIKRAVDPDDVFWCTPCVGNERWREVDGRLCRVERP